MEDPLVLGVDIGGSHITAGFIDLGSRMVVSTSVKQKLVNPHDSADSILNSWCEMIREAYIGNPCRKRIAIAMPGPFNYETGICLIKDQDKFQSLYLIDVKTELAMRLNIPAGDIKFVNDAEAFLKGEIFAGTAVHKSVLGITLGTGLGSALYLDGEVKDADLWNTPFCNGIAEGYLASGWFVARYFELTGLSVKGVKELAEIAPRESKAKQVFSEFSINFARFLKPLVDLHDLEMVILGGKISFAFELFSQELKQEMSYWPRPVVVKVSSLKEHAALLGAAAEKFDNTSNGHKTSSI